MPDIPEVPIWATQVSDQLQASIENKDPATYASIALDAMLRAYSENADPATGLLDFNVAVAQICRITPPNVLLVCAEAVCRLYNQKVTDG